MPVFHCRPSLLARKPVLELICLTLGTALREENVYLCEGTATDYEIRFDDNTSWFSLDHVFSADDITASFCLELMVSDRGQGEMNFKNESMENLCERIYISIMGVAFQHLKGYFCGIRQNVQSSL